MLSVGLIFIYILFTAYLTGYLSISGIRHICAGGGDVGKAEPLPVNIGTDGYVMTGLAVITVYAQLFSLFYKVGLLANLLLLVICGVTLAVFRRQIGKELRERYLRTSVGMKIFYAVIFVLFAYGASRGIIHYDTGLYHAQSIRWIEEYGVVKGLGNLHCRLAYNSASFCLSAFYSFAFLGGQSFHCAAGVFALLLAKVCGELAEAWRRKRLFLSDIARMMGIYYLLIIFDEIISPASDYFMVLTVFYIVIRYLDLAEREEKSWFPFALLSLLCVYTMSIKLSAALIVLLTVKPAVMLIKERNLRGIFCFTGLGILMIAPYFIRNVVISGWMVYPFTSIDFFQVDWRIPKGIADYDAKEIQVWGRGIHDVARYGEPVSSWFGDWFALQGMIDRLFIVMGITAAPVSAAAYITALICKWEKYRDMMLAAVTVNLSFLFWLLSAPLIRYGCVYVWLAAPLTFGGLALWLIKNGGEKHGFGKWFWRLVYLAAAAAGCYKLGAFGSELTGAYSPQYFIVQKDYEDYETIGYEINHITFYYPAAGDRTGYDAFPSAPSKAEIELRGDSLAEGFRYKENERY